ncbi:MAG: Gfo/Idh/MocA family protein [Vicinamibacterales bacterium]
MPAPQPIRIAVTGLGKIARDQHLPALAADPRFALAATASPDTAGLDGVAHFDSLEALLAHGPRLDAVALCTPPQVRHGLAMRAIAAGLHVLLEKPPGATVSEVEALLAAARRAGTTLFAAWHSRFAGGVAPARDWLRDRRIERVTIVWREDVRAWHPGQAWIWEPGGLGVFDPGINALSIATALLPDPLALSAATLEVPANRAAPIAARLSGRTAGGAPAAIDLDWRQTGPQTWDIVVETDHGPLRLGSGGASLSVPGAEDVRHADREYPGLYDRFQALIRGGASDVDLAPFRLVADAFLIGRRETAAPFHD